MKRGTAFVSFTLLFQVQHLVITHVKMQNGVVLLVLVFC